MENQDQGEVLIPKSLAISVIAGVVAAGILGVLLFNSDTDRLTFVDGKSVSVVTDSKAYKTGDNVTISIVNSGTEPIVGKATYGVNIRTLDTTLIYATARSSDTIAPGQKIDLTWPQLKDGMTPVLHGVYVIHVDVEYADGGTAQDSVAIEILR